MAMALVITITFLIVSIWLNWFLWWKIIKPKDEMILKLKKTVDNCFKIINQQYKDINFAILDHEELKDDK